MAAGAASNAQTNWPFFWYRFETQGRQARGVPHTHGFSCPRGDDDFRADIKTDLFALGSTIYFIVMGHAIYPDIVDGEEGYRRMEGERLAKRDWPREQHVCGTITLKCWE
ncbi:hypothetical protein C8A05DRAFT_20460 [Staphylotrichum tortipilum]|uniref:Protein kinase domain-containing protein n=1 Tax=Staphylotrichum tortipilum TaxID=2831512 RepID=A0AAN6M8K0_9PEZI|nr:hypothetical protein C8A05DRAFT_20460 [Staphylotrichum longicolle]